MFKVSCGLLKLGFIGVYSYKNWRNCSMECLHGSEKANTQLTCHYWGLSIKWHAAPACNQGCFVLTQNYWLNWTLWLSLPTACWRPTPSPASTALCRHTAPAPCRLYRTKYKLLLQKWQPPIYCKKMAAAAASGRIFGRHKSFQMMEKVPSSSRLV